MPRATKRWQVSDLPSVTSTHKITTPYNRAVFGDHLTDKNQYISTTTMSMATKLGRVGIYNKELWP